MEASPDNTAADDFFEGCQLISQGAEARVWQTELLGRQAILKQRFNKKYRHPTLDTKLTNTRLKQEVRSLLKARKLGVMAPTVYLVDFKTRAIYMEHVAGKTMKEVLNAAEVDLAEVQGMLVKIGQAVAMLHDGGVVHGDLTTSNIIVRDNDQQVVLIDFGLSSNTSIAEDKGVDLYVLERAFTSAHSIHGNLFDKVLEAYKGSSRHWSSTLNRFAEVRMRGRKRLMVG
ncbi:hypothetical protein WJX74_002962 [Apatococcus lobatus]|uniref:non-specific serine/threonine protein kinase n=1 Tax=Apatococcus lobatus TaxID=904363 RepID=A0AAW1RC05_9CHLO